MSSRLRAVRIFTLAYEKQMFLVRRQAQHARRGLAIALSPARRAHF